MSSEQTCICLIHAVYTKCENSCVCEKEATIYSHNNSAAFRNLKQQWFSWSSPVSVETQTRVTKGHKMGRAEAIQTGVVDFQRYHCLSLSAAYRYLRKEWNTVIKNELCNLSLCQKSPIQSFFSLADWGLGCCLRRFHQTQIWVTLKKVWELLILAILA